MFLDRVLGPYLAVLAKQARRPCLKWTRTFVLFACLVGPSALAHASPPDPLWLPGVYDGGDHDDEVALLTDTPAAGNSPALATAPTCPALESISVRFASA